MEYSIRRTRKLSLQEQLVVFPNQLDLFVQTMYAWNKKGNLSVPIDEQASINTPEAGHSTVPANNIAHTSNESQESSNTDRRPFNIKESGKVKKRI